MPDIGCPAAMELLNQVFATKLILNDGHEILERLEAGDGVVEIIEHYNEKFGQPEMGADISRVIGNWPALHLEATAEMVRWALSKLDTPDRITINWKGDAEHPETVTKIELRDHNMLIEFAHPPVRRAVPA